MMNVSDTRDLAAMVEAYLGCAAWTAQRWSEDGDSLPGLPDDMGRGSGEFTIGEDEIRSLFDLATIVDAVADCAGFVNGIADDASELEESDQLSAPYIAARAACDALDAMDPARAGHDFYLTRNGHGAGFWDRGLGAAGDMLSEACRPHGETNYVLTYDGQGYDA